MAKDKRVPRSNQRVRRCPPSTLECPEANRQPSLSWVDETGCSVYRASACPMLVFVPSGISRIGVTVAQRSANLPVHNPHWTNPWNSTFLSGTPDQTSSNDDFISIRNLAVLRCLLDLFNSTDDRSNYAHSNRAPRSQLTPRLSFARPPRHRRPTAEALRYE